VHNPAWSAAWSLQPQAQCWCTPTTCKQHTQSLVRLAPTQLQVRPPGQCEGCLRQHFKTKKGGTEHSTASALTLSTAQRQCGTECVNQLDAYKWSAKQTVLSAHLTNSLPPVSSCCWKKAAL
jgi:hypothetical protein